MDFTALQTAFFRRGNGDFDDAGAGLTEAKRFLNQSYLEICEVERWPFLRTTATGTAPLAVADLGAIESVRNTAENSVQLAWRDPRDLTLSYSDLTTAGSPRYWYIDNGTVRVWPVGGTLSVIYYKVPAELSAGGDTPVVPSRFQEIIVVGADARAKRARSNFEAAQALQDEFDRVLDVMRVSLLDQQDDGNDLILVTAGADDW